MYLYYLRCPTRHAAIACPTLVVHGDTDHVMPAANGDALARTITGARLVHLRGVGHMFWVQAPNESSECISSFFANARTHMTSKL